MHLSCFYPFSSSCSQGSHRFFLSNQLLSPVSHSVLTLLCLFFLPANSGLSQFSSEFYDGWPLPLCYSKFYDHISSWPQLRNPSTQHHQSTNTANVSQRTFNLLQPGFLSHICNSFFCSNLSSQILQDFPPKFE